MYVKEPCRHSAPSPFRANVHQGLRAARLAPQRASPRSLLLGAAVVVLRVALEVEHVALVVACRLAHPRVHLVLEAPTAVVGYRCPGVLHAR